MKNVTLIVLGMLLYSGPGSDARLQAQTKPAAALSQTDTQRLLNCLQKGCGDAARMLRDAHTLKISAHERVSVIRISGNRALITQAGGRNNITVVMDVLPTNDANSVDFWKELLDRARRAWTGVKAVRDAVCGSLTSDKNEVSNDNNEDNDKNSENDNSNNNGTIVVGDGNLIIQCSPHGT